MNKNKYYIGIIVFLLACNILLMFFLLQRPGRRPNHSPKRIVIERLGLNHEQIEEYESLIKKHRNSIFHAEHELNEKKQLLYSELLKESSSKETENILSEISDIEKQALKSNLDHFRDIKELCKGEEQNLKFEHLIHDLSKIFSKENTSRPPPPPHH